MDGSLSTNIASYLQHKHGGRFGVAKHYAVGERVRVRFIDLNKQIDTSMNGKISFKSS